jgi:hypothetical protein
MVDPRGVEDERIKEMAACRLIQTRGHRVLRQLRAAGTRVT